MRELTPCSETPCSATKSRDPGRRTEHSTRAAQGTSALACGDCARKHRDRDDVIVTAYATGAYSYREIAEHFQLHLATVGRIIRARMLQCEN